MKSALERKKPKKKKLGRVAPKHTPTSSRETDYSKKPGKPKKEGPLEKRPKKKKKLGRVSAKHTPTSSRETDYSKKPGKPKKTGPIKKEMDNSAAANQLKELGNPNKKIGDKLKAKIKSWGNKKKKPIGRVSAKHSPSTSRETDYSKKPAKKTGPLKKTNSWEEHDVKMGRKQLKEGHKGHAQALFDDAHGSWNWSNSHHSTGAEHNHVVNRIAGKKNR
tara:strand:- start:86 stop:742 length:657 start_codon:yes stop_codon:yes gene_type:complete